MLKTTSVTQPISRVFRLVVDLEQYRMIYSFVGINLHLYFISYKVYVSFYLDRCLNTAPCHSQELYIAKL